MISRLVAVGFRIEAAHTASFWEGTSPYATRTPAPSNLGAQLESLLVEKMEQLQASLVTRLKSRMDSPKSEQQQHIYVMYLTMFVLLYNLEFLYQDQMLKTVRNLLRELFPSSPNHLQQAQQASMMEHWEASANILLAHFRVIYKGKAPFSRAGILQCGSLDTETLEYVSAIRSHLHARGTSRAI